MESITPNLNIIDPWHGKAAHFSVITFALLSIFLTLAVYDGATFFARFQQACMSNPSGVECKNFGIPTNVQTKPTLNIVLNYDNGRYSIQTGAYRNESKARDNISQLQSNGIQARIIKVKDAKRIVWYQVQFGRFLDKKKTAETAQQLKLKGFIQDYTVASYSAENY